MTNLEIAKLLRFVAAAYIIKNESKYRFQIIAYQRAADAIEGSSAEVSDLFKEGKIDQIPGVGISIRAHLEELIKTGKVKHFDWVLKNIPKAVFSLMEVPTIGPKKAYRLVKEFNLNNEGDAAKHLLNLAKKGKIANLEGFGEKSQSDIIRAIDEYRQGMGKTKRMLLPFAFELAQKMIDYLKTSKDVSLAFPLGSLRRMAPTIGDIDIAVATESPKKVIDFFLSYPYKNRVIEKGDTTASILVNGGKQIDLMTQSPKAFGSLLQHFTGSKYHNVHLREEALKKGLSLSEYGIKEKIKGKWQIKTFTNEEEFYAGIGMQWVPPEMREDRGEIELALKHSLPKLVDTKDIKGDLHIHSNYPIEPSHDLGQNSMEEMIKKAKELNYEYIAFSEHNPSVGNHSADRIYSILAKRKEKIEQLKESIKGIRIINLLEVDILSDGDLAVNDKCSSQLDAMLVSIHSSFSMPKEQMTKRIINGLSHPKAKILSHPTGRLLNERTGYEVDWEKLFEFVLNNHKALEINASPSRLDLPDTIIQEAVGQKVKMVIDTDSHAASQMDLMRFGIAAAHRGWAEKNDILNTLEYNKLLDWLIL